MGFRQFVEQSFDHQRQRDDREAIIIDKGIDLTQKPVDRGSKEPQKPVINSQVQIGRDFSEDVLVFRAGVKTHSVFGRLPGRNDDRTACELPEILAHIIFPCGVPIGLASLGNPGRNEIMLTESDPATWGVKGLSAIIHLIKIDSYVGVIF